MAGDRLTVCEQELLLAFARLVSTSSIFLLQFISQRSWAGKIEKNASSNRPSAVASCLRNIILHRRKWVSEWASGQMFRWHRRRTNGTGRRLPGAYQTPVLVDKRAPGSLVLGVTVRRRDGACSNSAGDVHRPLRYAVSLIRAAASPAPIHLVSARPGPSGPDW